MRISIVILCCLSLPLFGADTKPKELKSKRVSKSVVSPPEYLLFLKMRKDGMYQPVSGQLDAAFSVRALFPTNHIKIP